MRAVGYVRVSTDKQADRGISLDAQVEKVRAMATLHSAELVKTISDAGESAKSLDRPGMQRVLEMVRARSINMVIVAKLDRLTRSVRDLADLLELFERKKCCAGFRCGSARYGFGGWKINAQHHGVGFAMGERSD